MPLHLAFEALVDQTFVRGVLIDDDDARLRLCDDVILVHLRAGGAQWHARGRALGLGGRLGPCAVAALHVGETGGLRGVAGGAGLRRRAIHLIDARAAEVGTRLGLERAQRAGGHGGRCAVPGASQRMTQARHDQSAHGAGIAKAHLGFRRVDVDVDQCALAVDKERRHRVPVAAEHVEISRAQGPEQHPVAHRAAIDEEVLRHRRAARIGGQARAAGHVEPVPLGIDMHRIVGEIAAYDPAQPRVERMKQIAGFGIRAKGQATLAAARYIAQGKTDLRLGHRQTLDDVANRLRLGAVGAHEFQARGRGEEQIAQRDDRAAIQRGRAQIARLAARHGDFRALVPCRARRDRQPPDCAQRRQRLAAKAEAVDIQQVGAAGLGCRVPGQRKRQIDGRHAAAVIRDADQRLAAIRDLDGDAPRACVDGILDQLLDCRCGPLDHFAGSDTVDRRLVKLANYGHGLADMGGMLCHATRLSMVRIDSTTAMRTASPCKNPPLPALALYIRIDLG